MAKKSKAIDQVFKEISKRYKDDNDTKAGYHSSGIQEDVKVYSTGSLMLDMAIDPFDRGGLPKGRMLEIYGPESAGKTTICLLAIASRQKIERDLAKADPDYVEKKCVFLDAEHTFDSNIAYEYGINLDDLIYISPKTAEQAIDVLDAFIRTNDIGLAVIDSVPSLVPSKMEESSMEQGEMASLARFMSKACMKLIGAMNQYGTTVILINQIREKVGTLYGNPETTPGGRAVKFYSTIRIKVTAGDKVKDGNDIIGHQLKFNIVKNKISAPFRTATTTLIYGEGVDKNFELAQIAVQAGVVKKAGAWFSLIDDNGEVTEVDGKLVKYQGMDAFVQGISESENLYNLIQELLVKFQELISMPEMTAEEIALLEKEEQEE